MSGPSKMQRKRLKLYDEQNGLCIYCHTKMWSRGVHKKGTAGSMATIEHIHPKGMGGSKQFSNLACSCSKCNVNRGQIDHAKFMKIRKRKNWQQLATEEKWRMQGIYNRKKREHRYKQFRRMCHKNSKYKWMFIAIQKIEKGVRFKNKYWHFTKVYFYRIKKRINKRIPKIKKDLKGLKWRIHNKVKVLQFAILKV